MNPLYRLDTTAVADEAFLAILLCIIKYFSRLYLFIDGLDECTSDIQSTILFIIHQLSRFKKPTVKIFLSSRDEQIISTSLNGFPRLEVSTERVSEDIAYFVEETVQSHLNSGELRIQDSALQQEIIATLTSQAQGM